jgi:diketogulonate reductase-like aldo/keto reductase
MGDPPPHLRPFGPTATPVPRIGLGTYRMEMERKRAVAAIRLALELGLTHIDTAEMYGSGAVEAIVGEAIAGRRDEVFLVSKVLPTNASRAGVRSACARSLERLRTDRLDLYLLHWPGPHPIGETLAAFEELVREGKIRSYGVSNFDVDELDEAVSSPAGAAIACNQVCYHLGARYIERSLLPRCRELGVALVGYSPFGSGSFPGPSSPGGARLLRLAEELGASPRQLALAFLTREEGTFAIPKSSDEKHLREIAGARDLALQPEAVSEIEDAFPAARRGGTLPIL